MFKDVRFRRSLAAVITVVLVAAVISAVWPRHGSQTVAAEPTTTSTTSSTTTSTTVPKPVHPFEAADAIVPEVNLYDAPGATEPSDSMSNPTSEHVPLAFLVKEQ